MDFLNKNSNKKVVIGFFQDFIAALFLRKNEQNYDLLDFSFQKISSFEESRKDIAFFIKEFTEKNRAGKQGVCLVIPPVKEAFLSLLDLPDVPKAEVVKLARWQLKKEISFNLDEPVLSWDIAQSYTDSEGIKKNKVIFAAAEEAALNKYLSVVSESSLRVLSVSTSLLDYENILRQIEHKNEKQAVLELRERYAVFSIYKNNKLVFLRELLFSPQKIVDSLKGVLVSGKSEVRLSGYDAKRIKDNFGIPKDPTQVLEENIQAIKIFSLMRPQLEGLSKEIRRSLDYFKNNFKEPSPEILYISGPAELKNLYWYLNREMGLEARRMPIPGSVNTEKLGKSRLEENYGKIISILGAAISGKKLINLLPKKVKNQRRVLIQNVFLKAIFTLSVAVLLVSFLSLRIQVVDYRKRLENTQIHLQTIQRLIQLRERIIERQQVLESIRKGKVPSYALLKLISSDIYPNIILNELFLDQDRKSLILRGVISATEKSAEPILIDFVEKIEASPVFSQAGLTQYRKDGELKSFEIKCSFKH